MSWPTGHRHSRGTGSTRYFCGFKAQPAAQPNWWGGRTLSSRAESNDKSIEKSAFASSFRLDGLLHSDLGFANEVRTLVMLMEPRRIFHGLKKEHIKGPFELTQAIALRMRPRSLCSISHRVIAGIRPKIADMLSTLKLVKPTMVCFILVDSGICKKIQLPSTYRDRVELVVQEISLMS